MWSAGNLRYRDLPAEWKQVSGVRGIRDVALIWLGIFVLAALTARYWHPALYAAAVVLVGGLQNHISSLIHHAIHTNIHPNKTLNDWITRLCLAGPQGQFFAAMRKEHLDHHRELGAADDPERFYYDLRLHGRTTATGFLTWVTGVFLGWVIIPIVSRWIVGRRGPLAAPVESPPHEQAQQRGIAQVPRREKLLDLAAIPPVQVALFGLFWLATGQWWGYIAFWALPLVTVGAGLNAVRATVEHANPDEHATAADPRDILFSFVSNPVERFFVCPLHFNYHYEHHRFMNVPYYHAPKLRQALIDSDDYTSVTLVPSYGRRVVEICRRLRERARGRDTNGTE